MEYEYSWGAQNPPTGHNYTALKYRLTAGASLTAQEHHCFDGLGRERQTIASSGTQRALTQQTYDGRSLVVNTQTYAFNAWCYPQSDLSDGPNNYVQYDPLGNPKTITNTAPSAAVTPCNPSCVQTTYAGQITTSLDQLNHKTESEKDGWGRTAFTREYTGTGSYTLYATTTYIYDTLGNLKEVRPQGLGSNDYTYMQYDALGRKTQMTDPDLSGYSTGTTRIPWTYKYDAAGNLIEQDDARAVETVLQYDSLGRLRKKIYNPPSPIGAIVDRPDVTYTYDAYDGSSLCNGLASTTAVGQLTKVTDGVVTTRYCYDERGREIRRRVSISITNDETGCSSWSRDYDILRAYDSADRLVSVTYPGGEVVTNGYVDSYMTGGKLKSMSSGLSTYIKSSPNIGYHISGAVASIPLETGATDQTTTYSYDTRYRLSGITTAGGSTVQDLDYTYLEDGNIDTIVDGVASETMDYAYDDLSRLTEMKINTVVQASYTYDPSTTYGGKIGNMTSKTEGGTTYNFSHGAEHIHAPTSWRGSGNTYDKNGNAVQVDADLNWYDVENRFSQVNYIPNSTTYLYDASGELVRRKVKNLFGDPGTEAKETFVEGIYQERSTGCAAPHEYTKYYTALGRVIAKRTGTISGGTLSTGTVTFVLSDHLGSNTTEVNASNGTVASTAKYWPFGATRAGAVSGRGYTGQQQEATNSTGLYYYHARFYSTAMGRFASADPSQAGGLNRFAYGLGNPTNLTDPSGLTPTDSDVQACASDVLSCLTFSYTIDFGLSDIALVIVGGRDQTAKKSLHASFEHIMREFLALNPACAQQDCYSALLALVGVDGSADAVFDIFGLRFVETSWNDSAAIAGVLTGAEVSLDKALNHDTGGKFFVGVVGFSLGANVVFNYFRRGAGRDMSLGFFLIEPWPYPLLYDGGACKAVPQCAKMYTFDPDFDWSWDFPPLAVTHDPHNSPSSAQDVISSVVARTVCLSFGTSPDCG